MFQSRDGHFRRGIVFVFLPNVAKNVYLCSDMMKRWIAILLCLLSVERGLAHDADSALTLKEHIFYHYDRSEFAEVVQCCNAALAVYQQDGSLFEMAGCYNVLGVAYQRLGRFEESIESYRMCNDAMERLKASESEKEQAQSTLFYDKNIRYTTNNMAKVFLVMEDYAEAERLYLDCIAMLGEPHDTIDFQDMATYRQNLAEVYMKQALRKTGEEKERLLQASVAMAEEAAALSQRYDKLPFKQASKTVMLAQAYQAAGRTNEALDIAKDALASAEAVDDPYLLAEAHAVTGHCEAELGHDKAAESHYRQAIQLATDNHFDELRIDLLKVAYDIASRFNKGLAFDYVEQYLVLKDSLFNEQQQRIVRDYQVKYDLAEKEHQLTLQTVINKNNRTVIVMLVVLVALLLALFVAFALIGEARKRQNEILGKISETKDRLFSIISHDFKNSVLSQALLLDAMNKHSDKMSENELHEKISLLKSSSDMLKEKMFGLLDWMKVEMAGKQGQASTFSLHELVWGCIDAHELDMEEKRVTVAIEVAESLVAREDENKVRLVLNNLLNNAIKYSLPDGRVRIVAEDAGKCVWVAVTDQGVGISEERLETLTKSSTLPSKDTQAGEGFGIGLMLCKQLIERDGGQLLIESKEGEGTTVRFSIRKQ